MRAICGGVSVGKTRSGRTPVNSGSDCEELLMSIGRLERTRPLSHRSVFEIHHTVLGRAGDEFSDKGARDIVLLYRTEWTGDQAPQPRRIARRMSIAGDDARAENRQPFETYALNRFFFQPHDPRIANPACGRASRCREQRKLRDTSGVTT